MFKSILTFIKRAMKKGNTLKTKVSVGCIFAAAAFGLGVVLMAYSFSLEASKQWMINNGRIQAPEEVFYGYSEYDSEYKNFLFINAPLTFNQFLLESNADNYFKYRILNASESPYDFMAYSKYMKDNDSCITVVFPKESEELILKDEALEVLTYIRTNKLDFYEAEEFAKDLVDMYSNYLKEVQNKPLIEVEASTIKSRNISVTNYNGAVFGFIAVIPLIVFIGILYTVMTGGTNVIAGEKERGTFAAIILTPAPRSSIVIGNILGITMLAAVPTSIISIVAMLLTFHPTIQGAIFIVLLVFSLTILIASITILLSIMNPSVVSAQTAFLPVFLIVLGIAINCIQKLGVFEKYFLFFPLFGHFFGLGNAITAGLGYYPEYAAGAVSCIVISLVLSGVLIAISTKLLYNERFMTNAGGISAKELKKSAKPKKELGISSLINHALFPVSVLSIVQLLALIPTAISYMRDDTYTEFIVGLKEVSGFGSIVNVISDVLAMFLGSPLFLISMTFGYILLIAIYCLTIRIKEHDRHPFKSMGFTGTSPVKKYLFGLGLGFALLSSVCLILVVTGNLKFSGLAVTTSTLPVILAGLPMWFVQGASEEIMFRGYMIPRIEKRFNRFFAVLFSSFLFAVFHGANIGFTWLAAVNLFIIAVFFALVYIYTDSIWVTCAAHTAWNFCQGSLYGLEVSGSDSGAAILASDYSENAPAIFTGGAFGPEGGLAVTIVTIVAIAVITVLLVRKNKSKIIK